MQQESHNKGSRRPLRGKNINPKLNKVTTPTTNNQLSPTQSDKKKDQQEKNIIPKINQQSISFIAKNLEGSFISNGHDRSIDSFDKLFGVQELLTLEDHSIEEELDYSALYRSFEKLCKHDYHDTDTEPHLHNEYNQDDKESNQDDKHTKGWEEEGSHGQTISRILKDKIEEVKEIRRQRGSSSLFASDPNISIRLLGANLSQIHEEEIHHDESMHRMDPIEEEFIDFVNKAHGPSRINISKIEEKKDLPKEEKKVAQKDQNPKQVEEDEVVAMLENELVSRVEPQEESLNEQQPSLTKKTKKESFLKENYKHILEQLDDNDERKPDTSHLSMQRALAKREEWILNRKGKSERWRQRELQLVSRCRQIIQNPYAEFSDEQDFQLSI